MGERIAQGRPGAFWERESWAERPEFVDKFRREIPHYDLRYSIPQGLRVAQVYGQYDFLPRQKLRYDPLYYIKNPSLWLDLKLIALSFWITFRGKWESRSEKF